MIIYITSRYNDRFSPSQCLLGIILICRFVGGAAGYKFTREYRIHSPHKYPSVVSTKQHYEFSVMISLML